MKKFFRGSKLIFLLLTCGVILFVVVGLLPGMAWRLDRMGAFVRGVLHPVQAAPAGSGWDTGGMVAAQTGGMKNGSEPDPNFSSLPQSVLLTPPVFDPVKDIQDWNNCGPATLALALRMYGWQGDQFTISRVIKPDQTDKNVSVYELTQYVNAHTESLQAVYRVNSSEGLIRQFLAAGYPVIIEEAFKLEQAFWPNDDLWAAHYLLITGYNELSATWTVQDSFYGPNRTLPMSVLEQSWKPFNRVMMVIFPPEDEEKIHTLWGADGDEIENWKRAEQAARKLILLNDKDAFSWFNLGSDLLAQQNWKEADAAFDRAGEIGLPQRMLRYQFGPLEAAYGTGEAQSLIVLANTALDRTPNSEETLYWKGQAYLLTGQLDAADKMFQRALEANPGYEPAAAALGSLSK